MAVDIAALKTELDTDPQALGLVTLEDGPAADILNLRGASSETIEPTFANAWDLQAGVDAAEYSALTPAAQNNWAAILISASSGQGLDVTGGIPIKDPSFRSQVLALWGAGTTTRTNVLRQQTRSASRGEVLFGEDTTVTLLEVHRARRLP